MPNTLEPGARRIGALIDFDANTPEVDVLLSRTDDGAVEVTMPWKGILSPYASWFFGGAMAGLPSRKELPQTLLFQDSSGTVLLVGCAVRSMSTNIGMGTGVIGVRAAVLDVAGREMETPSGMRAEVSGLRQWFGVTGYELDNAAPLSTVTVRSVSPTPIRDGLALQPIASIEQLDDGLRVLDRLLVEATTPSPTNWQPFIDTHWALRDFMTVSLGRTQHTRIDAVLSLPSDEPDEADADGRFAHLSEVWHRVESRSVEPWPNPAAHLHLVQRSDIGIEGLDAWLELRSSFARTVDPLVRAIGRASGYAEALGSAASAIEALAYQLLDEKQAVKGWGPPFHERVKLILDEVPRTEELDDPDLPARLADAYNGVKHANRALPDEVEVANAWRICVLILRTWIACRLGVDEDVLLERVRNDHLASPLVLAPGF